MSLLGVLSIASVLSLGACGEGGEGRASESSSETAPSPEAAPLVVPAPRGKPSPEAPPDTEAVPSLGGRPDALPEAALQPPDLDTEGAILSALRDAEGSPAAVWALTAPARGLDLDFNWIEGHMVATACSEVDMTTWLSRAQSDDLSFYELLPEGPFHCVRDLSLCASCPEDLSTCERGYVFEFGLDDGGRRRLFGVIANPAVAPSLRDLRRKTLEAVRRAHMDLGAQAEVGFKCSIRERLLADDLESLWVEAVPYSWETGVEGPRVSRILEGADAAAYARKVAGFFDLTTYCHSTYCVVRGAAEHLSVYFIDPPPRRGQLRPPPRVIAVAHGIEQCMDCPPELERETLEGLGVPVPPPIQW